MSSVRMKLICRQVIRQLLGEGINYAKINKLTHGKRLQFSSSDIKALIAALHFIIRNSAKFNVDSFTLPKELEQLGLPRDICKAIVREYSKAKDKLRFHLSSQTLHLPRLLSEETEWRVDYIMSSKELESVMAPSVRMKIHLDKSQPNQSINTYHQSYFLKNIKQHLHTHAKTDANKETSKSDSSNSDDSNNNNKGRNKTQETERGEGQAVSSITASMQSLSTSPSSPPSASRLSALSPLTAANTPSDSWIFELSAEKFSVLYNDLKQAQQIMEEIDEQQ